MKQIYELRVKNDDPEKNWEEIFYLVPQENKLEMFYHNVKKSELELIGDSPVRAFNLYNGGKVCFRTLKEFETKIILKNIEKLL